jgi:hypothetical protein
MKALVNTGVEGHLIDSDLAQKIGLQTWTLMRPLSVIPGNSSDTFIEITKWQTSDSSLKDTLNGHNWHWQNSMDQIQSSEVTGFLDTSPRLTPKLRLSE